MITICGNQMKFYTNLVLIKIDISCFLLCLYILFLLFDFSHSNEETVMVNVNDLTATLIESNKTKQLVRRNVGDYCMIFGNVIMQFFTSVYCVFLVNTLIFRHVGQVSQVRKIKLSTLYLICIYDIFLRSNPLNCFV